MRGQRKAPAHVKGANANDAGRAAAIASEPKSRRRAVDDRRTADLTAAEQLAANAAAVENWTGTT